MRYQALLTRRKLNLYAAVGCAGLLGYAYFAQFVLELAPCPLCIFQRIGVILAGVLFAVAAAHHPGRVGAAVYGVLIAVASGLGATVAGRHVWLQSLPADQVPACGPGLDYMLDVLPLPDVIDMVFSGSGECAEVDWMFLGLSMPGWMLVIFIGMGVYGLVNNLRPLRGG